MSGACSASVVKRPGQFSKVVAREILSAGHKFGDGLA